MNVRAPLQPALDDPAAAHTVCWRDTQYQREIEIHAKLSPHLESIAQERSDLARRTQHHEREFFTHLSHSVKIDRLRAVNDMAEELNDRLNTTLKINLFLYQSPISNAMCMPRFGLGDRQSTEELVILVSQHFFNELSRSEQLAIIGHELGHLLHGHVHTPARSLLEAELPLGTVQSLKSDVLKWLMCAEVSCDVMGFLGCGRDVDAFSNAMIKFTTGLSATTFSGYDNGQDLVKLVLDQCEMISDSVLDTMLTTHPLTPLRLSIIHALADCPLLTDIGEDIPAETLKWHKDDYTNKIDEQFARVYPEVVPTQSQRPDETLFRLLVAVAASDGHVQSGELAAIGQILDCPPGIQQWHDRIEAEFKAQPADALREKIINQATEVGKQKKLSKNEAVRIVRLMIMVAASDGKIEVSELETVFQFANHFGFTKQEIVLVIQQMGLH